MSISRLPPAYSSVPFRELRKALTELRTPLIAGARAYQALSTHLSGRSIVFADSGTSALRAGIEMTTAAETPPIVALPGWCCPDVGAASIGANARVLLYDLDPATLEPDLEDVHRCLLMGATHVVVVHYFGRPTDVDSLSAIAKSFGAVVVEDAAQGGGAQLDKRPAGTLAEISVLSFGRGKGWNAGGGGALSLQLRPELEPLNTPVSKLRRETETLVRCALAELLSDPVSFGVASRLPFLHVGETRYRGPKIDRGIATTTLALLPFAIQQHLAQAPSRRQVSDKWRIALASVKSARILRPVPLESVDSALRLPAFLPCDSARDLIPFGVAKGYPRTLAEYSEIARRRIDRERLPGAETLASGLFTLPTHRGVSDTVINEAVRCLAAAAGCR